MARDVMRSLLLVSCLLASSLVACLHDVFLPRDVPEGDASDASVEAGPTSGATTLYTNDPLRSSYDFDRADYGAVVQDGQVKNAGSHIAFGTFREGAFSVGVQGGDTGVIVDLGTDDEVAQRIGAVQTVGGGQGFAGLTLGESGFNDARANGLLTTEPRGTADADVRLRHVYVVRIVRPPREDLVVKLLVVSFTLNESAGFQWIRLR